MWILKDIDTGLYVKSTSSGIKFTDNINESKVYHRLCSVHNSMHYWQMPYGSYWRKVKSYKLIKLDVKVKILNVEKL